MRFAELDTSGENIFTDVSENDWFYDYVVGAIKYGWITGYPMAASVPTTPSPAPR